MHTTHYLQKLVSTYVGAIMANEMQMLGWSIKIQENLQQVSTTYISGTKLQVHKHIPKLFKIANAFLSKNTSIDERKNELLDFFLKTYIFKVEQK